VRFRLNNSVYSVECEYTSKNKANIDEQLRDDLSDDDFENKNYKKTLLITANPKTNSKQAIQISSNLKLTLKRMKKNSEL